MNQKLSFKLKSSEFTIEVIGYEGVGEVLIPDTPYKLSSEFEQIEQRFVPGNDVYNKTAPVLISSFTSDVYVMRRRESARSKSSWFEYEGKIRPQVQIYIPELSNLPTNEFELKDVRKAIYKFPLLSVASPFGV